MWLFGVVVCCFVVVMLLVFVVGWLVLVWFGLVGWLVVVVDLMWFAFRLRLLCFAVCITFVSLVVAFI